MEVTLQYYGGFCHTSTWIGHRCTCVPPSWTPLTSLPPHPSGLPQNTCTIIGFTYGSIHVSVLFSQIIPLSPSPTQSNRFLSKLPEIVKDKWLWHGVTKNWTRITDQITTKWSYLILCDPMDYTVHGILHTRTLEWAPLLSPGDLPNPGIKPRSPALQADSLPAEPQRKPKNTGVASLSLLQQIFLTCIAGGFFTTELSGKTHKCRKINKSWNFHYVLLKTIIILVIITLF